MGRIYLRGDAHGDFSWLSEFCMSQNTTTEDIMVILGDAGLNYYLNKSERKRKCRVGDNPITLICIQGNHEKRPEEAMGYELIYKENFKHSFWIDPKVPNIWFATNGEMILGGREILIADGAYSVDKEYRLLVGNQWFPDEQMSPDDEEKLLAISKEHKHYDYIFSHTAPLQHEPKYLFLGFLDQSKIDKHTEWILQEIANNVSFDHWFFAHYHDTNLAYEESMSILYHTVIDLEKFERCKANGLELEQCIV